MALPPSLRKIPRFGPLAVPLMRLCYLTESIFHHLFFLQKFIYVCYLCTLPQSANSVVLETFCWLLPLTLFSYSHPLWNSENHLDNSGLYHELHSGAHSGRCMVPSAAGGLLLLLLVWTGCMTVAQWVDLRAVECGLRLRTSASHDPMIW